jgi:hypothetical protein
VAFTLLTGLAIVLSTSGQRSVVKPLLDFASAHPRSWVLLEGLITAAVVFIAARVQHRVVSQTPLAPVGVCLAAIIAMPLAGAGKVPEERVNLVAAVRNAWTAPSVLEWNAYYDVLQKTILPRMPLPRPVVDELRRRVPPRQVVVANPSYSCSLAVVLDAYCINPEFIYGQYYLTARGYQDHYVHSIDGVDEDWHPFFNATWPLEDRERTFLQEYSVNYLLADPLHAALIDRKLRALNIRATLESSHNGYVLYSLGY